MPTIELDERLVQENHRLAEQCSELKGKVIDLQLSAAEYKEHLRRFESLANNISIGVFRFCFDDQDGIHAEYFSNQCQKITGIDRWAGLSALKAFSNNSFPSVAMPRIFDLLKAAVPVGEPLLWEGQVIVGSLVRFIRIRMNRESVTKGSQVYNGTIEDISAECQEREKRRQVLASVDLMAQMITKFRNDIKEPILSSSSSLLETLSDRERQVVDILLLGLSNKEIAQKLFISESTVKKHLSRIFEKLGISNRTELFHLCRGAF
jgi:DNA-binding CsgD family transcriptional regulator